MHRPATVSYRDPYRRRRRVEHQLLKQRQVAERLGVSRWTVLRLRQAGDLETVFVRGAVRIPDWSVDEYIRGGTDGPAAGGARDAA